VTGYDVGEAMAGIRQATEEQQPSLADQLEAQLIDAEELIRRPPPAWAVAGVIPAAGTIVLFGKPGSGKSFTALDWGSCTAMGLPWQGHHVQQGPVVYIAAEGVGGLGARVAAWKAAFGVDEITGITFYPGAVNLLDAERRAALVEVMRRRKPAMLIIDTLARSMTGGDENSARDVGLVIAAADACHAEVPPLTILIVHHMDKSGSTYRGSSALEGAAETMVECTDDDGLMKLSCEKQKDAAGFPPIRLRRVIVDLADGRSSCVLRAPSTENLTEKLADSRRLLIGEFLTHFSATGASRAQLKLVSKLTEPTFYRALNDLLKVGALVNSGTDKQPFYKRGTEP